MLGKIGSLFRGCLAKAGLAGAAVALLALMGGVSAASAAEGKITTTHWKEGSSEGYHIDATVNILPGLGLASVTMKGPGITAPEGLSLAADLSGTTYAVKLPLTARPAVGAAYTFSVTYLDNTAPAESLTVTVSNVLDSFATPLTPVGGVASTAAPTLAWSPPAPLPANFSIYSVAVSGPELQWSLEGLGSSESSTPYGGSTLAPAVLYQWSIIVQDDKGNKAENRTSFMLGANFTGKVTNIIGSGLAGVAVDVTDLAGNVKPTVYTFSDGSYIYGGLPTGSYKITFSSDTASVYYKNKLELADADTLALTAGALTTNVNAVLGGWGAVAGSVYLSGTARPAGGVEVALYDSAKVRVASVPAETVLAGGSGSFGTFQLSVIRPGSYFLKFTAAGYAEKWLPATVTLNTVSNVGAVLSSGIPTITTFTVPASSSSLTVTGITLAASEYNGVTGYRLTESSTPPSATATGWSATPPTSYTFGSAGAKTLYAWAKGTGGVSAGVSRSVTVTASSTVAVTIAGNGSVTSTPGGISCISGSTSGCSASFAGGSSVTLIPAPTLSSTFAGWSGACTGTGNCVLAINGAKSVTATFSAKTPTVRIDGNPASYYSINEALSAAGSNGQIVRAKAESFVEQVLKTSPGSVQLKGGYTDDAFSLRSGASRSSISGSLKIRGGQLRVERLVVR